MANQIRSPSDILKGMLGTIAATAAGPAVLEALRASLQLRLQIASKPAQPWTVTEALQALDPQEDSIVELFAALRMLEGAQPERARLGYSHLAEEDPVRLDQALLLEFARAEITSVEESRGAGSSHRAVVEQTAIGLLGPNGALPYSWTEHAHDLGNSAHREQRDKSFVAWINVIQRRQIGLLYRAWGDSQSVVGIDRPSQPHPLGDRLRALAGLELADASSRDRVAPGFKMAFAAVLSRRVRSPQPLAAMLSYHFDAPVRVEEFVSRWLEIPVDQRTRIGMQFNQLGNDAVAGSRVWDCATRFRLYIGPLSLERYREFLPHGRSYAELADLVTLYAGVEYEWDLVPILEAPQVPYSWLGNEGLLLGWSSWLGVRYDTTDAADLNLHMAPSFKPKPESSMQSD